MVQCLSMNLARMNLELVLKHTLGKGRDLDQLIARQQVIAALIMDVAVAQEVQNFVSRSGHKVGGIYVFVPVVEWAKYGLMSSFRFLF